MARITKTKHAKEFSASDKRETARQPRPSTSTISLYSVLPSQSYHNKGRHPCAPCITLPLLGNTRATQIDCAKSQQQTQILRRSKAQIMPCWKTCPMSITNVQLLQTKRSPIPIDADKHRPKAKCSFVVQALIPQTAHVE